MKVNTSELIGAALNWAFATCEGWGVTPVRTDGVMQIWHNDCISRGRPTLDNQGSFRYLAHGHEPVALFGCPINFDWCDVGPIIEWEQMGVFPFSIDEMGNPCQPGWSSFIHFDKTHFQGPTPLIAAMRCYVASKLGDEVEVPDELINERNT